MTMQNPTKMATMIIFCRAMLPSYEETFSIEICRKKLISYVIGRHSPPSSLSITAAHQIVLRFFYFQKSDKREMPDFNVFYRYYCTYPWYSDGIWFLTQMRRWGQITEPKSDEWYHKTAKEVYRPDIYLKAAKMLLDEGFL